MMIFSVYKDFFKFLDELRPKSEKWKTYDRFYYQPHKEFLNQYFSCFPFLEISNLQSRVEAVKPGDYSLLRGLISACPPEPLVEEAFYRAQEVFPPPYEPDVYLMIGFFSPDGFVLDYKNKPVICFGLERFKHFRLLPVLFAHEYAHFLLRRVGVKSSGLDRWERIMLFEGMAAYFSYVAIPGYSLAEHFFFRRDELNWYQANQPHLKRIYRSGNYASLSPKGAKYLGFQAAKKYVEREGEQSLRELFSNPKLALFSVFKKRK